MESDAVRVPRRPFLNQRKDARAGRYRLISLAALIATFLVSLCSPERSEAQARLTRILVNKKLLVSSSPAGITFQPLPTSASSRSGFSELGDYVSQSLYEGPETSAAQFRGDVIAQGFETDTATDLNYLSFHDHVIDPETGAATPPFPADAASGVAQPTGADALFLLVLKGPPTDSWRADLQANKVRLLEALPPVAYLVRGNPSLVKALTGSVNYVRSAFPVLPNMKTLPFPEATSDSPFRPVWIQAVEETTADSIRSYLSSVAQGAVDRGALAGQSVLYRASLSDLDVRVVSTLSNVYAISADGQVSLASERQGILIIQPDVSRLPRITTPPNSPNYAAVLISKGVTDFNNTKIGMLDTGFDDGTSTHPDFQVGGPQVTVLHEGVWGDGADRDTHGTMVASVLVGFAPFGSARKDAENYRYTLGLAESCKLVADKLLQCNGSADFMNALDITMAPQNVNIINLSYEIGGCQYTMDSLLVDSHTRSQNWLFTIAAGNDTDPGGAGCHNVGAPGTAKNGITVGATNNYTPQSLNWTNCPPNQVCPGQGRVTECLWNGVQADSSQDARNIPNFSRYRDPNSLVKPDLVAPAVRVTGPVDRNPVGNWCPADSQHRGVFCNESLATTEGVTYGFSVGTSFAAPAAAGAAAAVRKWYNVTLKPGFNPSPAMTKAILINGARDLNGAQVLNSTFGQAQLIKNILYQPYNDYQGWGMLNLTRLLDSIGNHFSNDQESPLSGSNSWTVTRLVTNGALETRITVAWTDVPSSLGSTYNVVNNLDLIVCSNSGLVCYYANRFNASGYSQPTPGAPPFSDGKNVVEEVALPANAFPTGQALFIYVFAKNVMMGSQDFAIFGSNVH